jgi:hypothetical protein
MENNKRFVAFPEGKEKILVSTSYHCFVVIGHPDSFAGGSAVAPFIYTIF